MRLKINKQMKKDELLGKEQNLYDLIYIKDIIFIRFYHQWGTSCTEKLYHSLKVIKQWDWDLNSSYGRSRSQWL